MAASRVVHFDTTRVTLIMQIINEKKKKRDMGTEHSNTLREVMK